MDIRILLLLLFLTVLVTDDANAGKFSSFFSRSASALRGTSRGSTSRGSTSRGSTSRGSSHLSSHHSSSSHSSSRPSGNSHGSSSNTYGHNSSPGRQTSSSSQFGHGSSSGGYTTGSRPVGSSSGQTSHQQNKNLNTQFLHAEGGGATRPGNHYPGSQVGRPGFTTENKQNSASYNPSAPPADHSRSVPSQNHAPTSFGQLNAPFNPSHRTVPHNNNPSWSNPHYNPSQSYPPGSVSTNVGFKDHLRPTSTSVSSHVPSAPYPNPPYPNPPTSNFNQRPPYPTSSFNQHPPYPIHPSTNYPTHSAYNPNYHPLPGQTIGHPSSYPAHVPPPVPGTFGNPYSTHPIGSAYGPTGHSYYPQQHVLAQPAAQPYIPGQTVIMVPGKQDSGRGFGQMVKEALVFSTINAGVNRLLNPHHHHHHFMSDTSRPIGSSTSETHITYNNHYFNGAPTDSASLVPGSPNAPQNGATYPVNYPAPVNNPVITPGVSIPTIAGNNGSNASPITNSFAGTTGTTNDMGSFSARTPNRQSSSGNTNMNDQGASNQWATVNFPQYKISDNELWSLTEELFAKQGINVFKYLTLNLQNTVKSQNIIDEAKDSLIYTQQEIYDYPTIMAIRALYDNYEHDSTVKENHTPTKRKQEDLLLDVFLNTNVMARAMQWLSDRGFLDPDDFDRKDNLRSIWFNHFNGATSGFERVFASERYGSDLLGVQDWIYFDYQESKKRIDYMGYVDTLKLGENALLLKLNFKMDDIIRPNATIFVGTLPELEMSLYTICFYARPNNLCPVSLGGTKFNIYTHSFRYFGKDLIDLALPIF